MQSHTKKPRYIYLSQAETSQFAHMYSFPWYFKNIRTLCYSLLLLCKYVVSRLQHNIDSLHVDNTVNDIDLLYFVVCYTLSP